MTGLEILTATTHQAGVAYFVFYDGELSQISQGQEIPYNRKTCTVLGDIRLEGVARRPAPLTSQSRTTRASKEGFARRCASPARAGPSSWT